MNRKFRLALLILSLPIMAQAGVKVSSLDLTTNGDTGYVKINLDGQSNDLPDIRVYGNVIELTLSQSLPFDSISKTVRGTLLTANTINGKAIVKAILPYGVSQEKVQIGWKNKSIEVAFPRGSLNVTKDEVLTPVIAVKPQPVSKTVSTNTVLEKKISKEVLNEDYLNKLMKEEVVPSQTADPKKDQISFKQAAPVVKAKTVPIIVSSKGNDFSFLGYTAKFAVFLAAVLGLFYGVVQLLKKGIFSRGKLSFLNNSQMIQVLSTTYVAPKRSLMIVKAHKQIFLVANSESGLTYLSEMTDTSGLIKEGEKILTGTNFDEKLDQLEAQTGYEAFIKVKENIMESTPVKDEVKGLAKLASAKDDIVKFSDELKKKAKKLKPIEFN